MAHINPWRQDYGAIVPNWLLERTEVGAAAKLIYARLRQFAGRRGYCWPSVETLGAHVGLSTRTVERSIQELASVGLLDVVRRGLNRTNLYYFEDHPWFAADLDVQAPPADGPDNMADQETPDLHDSRQFDGTEVPNWRDRSANLADRIESEEESQRRDSKKSKNTDAGASVGAHAVQTEIGFQVGPKPKPRLPSQITQRAWNVADKVIRDFKWPFRDPREKGAVAKTLDKLFHWGERDWGEIEKTIEWAAADPYWMGRITNARQLQARWSMMSNQFKGHGDWSFGEVTPGTNGSDRTTPPKGLVDLEAIAKMPKRKWDMAAAYKRMMEDPQFEKDFKDKKVSLEDLESMFPVNGGSHDTSNS